MNTAKRAALIESSVKMVANRGFHGASMSLIAGLAGVAAGTIAVHPHGGQSPFRVESA